MRWVIYTRGLHIAATLILVAVQTIPSVTYAACKEYRLEEFEDRIEAVCVGEPLTAGEKQALAEEEKRQEQLKARQKSEDERRQKALEALNAKKNTTVEPERKKQDVKPASRGPKTDAGKSALPLQKNLLSPFQAF